MDKEIKPTCYLDQRTRVEQMIRHAAAERVESNYSPDEPMLYSTCKQYYLDYYRWIEKRLNKNNIFLRVL